MQHSSWGEREKKSTRDISRDSWANCFEPTAFELEFEICSGARHVRT